MILSLLFPKTLGVTLFPLLFDSCLSSMFVHIHYFPILTCLCVNPLLQISMMSSVHYSGLSCLTFLFHFLFDIFSSHGLCNNTLSRFSSYLTNPPHFFHQLFSLCLRNVESPQDSAPISLLIIIHTLNRLSYLSSLNFTLLWWIPNLYLYINS